MQENMILNRLKKIFCHGEIGRIHTRLPIFSFTKNSNTSDLPLNELIVPEGSIKMRNVLLALLPYYGRFLTRVQS